MAEVFAHYRGHHPKARLGDKGARLLKARLAEGYSVAELKQAIDGYHASPFHCGVNKDSRAYLGLDLIARDAEHVNQGIEFAEKAATKPVVTTEKEKRTMLATDSWLERKRAEAARAAQEPPGHANGTGRVL